MNTMHRRSQDRLRALVLAVSFVAGSGTVVGADIVRHHLGTQHLDGHRHIELPGTCLEHQHQCDLGLSVTGHRLTASPQTQPLPSRESRLSLRLEQLDVPIQHSLLHLPDTRAPPLFG